MNFLGDNDLGFEKKVDCGIPIYTFTCSCQKYPTAIMEITDDFRKNGYPAMVIDNNEEEKKTIKGLMPLAEQKLKNMKDYYKTGYFKDFTLAKAALLGVTVPLIAISTYLSAHKLTENQLLSSTFPILTTAGILVSPYIFKKCMQIDAEYRDADIKYLPLFEEALDRPEF